jgi:hypothetical protein
MVQILFALIQMLTGFCCKWSIIVYHNVSPRVTLFRRLQKHVLYFTDSSVLTATKALPRPPNLNFDATQKATIKLDINVVSGYCNIVDPGSIGGPVEYIKAARELAYILWIRFAAIHSWCLMLVLHYQSGCTGLCGRERAVASKSRLG